MTIRRLVYGLSLIMIFTIPWENLIELPGLGRISRIVGLVVAAVWILNVLVSGHVRRPLPVHFAALAFVLWNALSVLWTIDLPATVERSFTFVQLFVLMLILWDTITTTSALSSALQAYIAGAALTAGSIIAGALIHGVVGYQDRFTTGTFQMTDVGLILALGIPAAGYIGLSRDAPRSARAIRLLATLYVPVAAVAIMLTGSRAALVASFPGFFYVGVCILRLPARTRVVSLVALAGLFLVLSPLVPNVTLQRLETTRSEVTAGDLDGRLQIWREAYATFRVHPILGVGSGAFRTSGSGKVAHDFAFRLLAELGLIGFLLFAGMLIFTGASIRGQPNGLGAMWASVFVTWLVGASLYNFEERKQTWLFFSLIVAGGHLIADRRGLSKEARADGVPAPPVEVPVAIGVGRAGGN